MGSHDFHAFKFPYKHRDGLYDGEGARYAFPLRPYCCTNFGEFGDAQLNNRPELWSGYEPGWEELVTSRIMQTMLESELQDEEMHSASSQPGS